MARADHPTGPLDGLTVLRITHAFERGGGLEQYLDDLNGVLSARSRFHTVQVRLNHRESGRASAACGDSRITTFQIPAETYARAEADAPARPLERAKDGIRRFVRDQVLYRPPVYSFARKLLADRPAPRGLCDPDVMLATVRGILAEFPVDCALLHSAGDRDGQVALKALAGAGIPTAVVNHFSNDRFLNSALREQALAAGAVGVVGRAGLPGFLAHRCTYVGDGVDLEFFAPGRAREVAAAPPGPRILLPARMVASKGHLDLIEAIALARQQGVALHVYFAGRADSPGYLEALAARASDRGVGAQVHILGELGREGLRDWYAASIATVLPTHHHEGLGRVTIESQAMGVPVVAYDIGGVREGFVDGATGFLLKLGDVAGLASALVRLATGASDGPAMGRAGRAFVEENFGFPVLAHRHEQFTLAVAGLAPSKRQLAGRTP